MFILKTITMLSSIFFFLLGAFLGTTFHPELKFEGDDIYLYYGKKTRSKKKLFKKFW